MVYTTIPGPPFGLGEEATEAGHRFGLDLWDRLPRPLRLLDRKGIAAEARLLCLAMGELLASAFEALRKVGTNRHPLSAEANVLPFLAWERWLPQLVGETVDQWRARLRDAWLLHQEGGTNAGVLRALRILGFTDAEVYEHRQHVIYYNGQASYDGTYHYGEAGDSWAHFSVVLPGVTTLAAGVLERLKASVNKVKAAHAKLWAVKGRIDLRYDGTVTYDGRPRYDGQTVVLG